MDKIRRRTVLHGLGGFAIGTVLSGCGGGNGAGSTASIPQPRPSGTLTSVPVPVTISGAPVGTVGANFAGLSYEKSSMAVPRFTADNAALIGLFRGLGPSLLRVGASSVDITHWAPAGAGRTSGQVAPSDIDALAGFLQQTGWTILYGINLATSTPAAAAAEAAYAVKAFGGSLSAVEFGNECNEYPGTFFPKTWSLADFEALWEQFRGAVLQAAPGVVVTGPGSATDISGWTIPFGQKVTKAQIVQLTQHTAYTVKSADGALNIVIVNKEVSQNLQLNVECGQSVSSARLLVLSGPALDATSGVTIQGAAVGADGSCAPGSAYAAQISGSTVTCYCDALNAVLLKVT
jgi:hypothetical protein